MKKLVSKSEYARLCNVSAAAVTKASATVLKDAVYGKRIDVSHPDAIKYLQCKESPAPGIDPLYSEALKACQENDRYTATNIRKNINVGYNRAKRILATIQAAGADNPVVIKRGWTAHNEAIKRAALEKLQSENYADMTLRDVIKKYGTDPAFSDWLKCIKLIEDINEKRLKNESTISEHVSRQLIKAGIVAPFETASNKLLTDGAKTMASRVTMMVDGGRSIAECEAAIVDQISSYIKMMKADSLKVLQNV